MKISKNIIIDLLPLYFDNEVCEDSKQLIDDYFNNNPEFAKKMQEEFELGQNPPVLLKVKPEEQMMILKTTKNLLKLRSLSFAIAMFGTLFPLFYFTFFDFKGRVFEGYAWVLSDAGGLTFVLGLIAWISYFAIRFRMRTTGV